MGEQGPHLPGDSNGDFLNNAQVFNLVMSKIDERVTNTVQQRFNNARTQLLTAVTIFAIVLAALGSTVLEVYVNSQVKGAAEGEVEEQVGPAVQEAVDTFLQVVVGPAVEVEVDNAVQAEVGAALDDVVGDAVEKIVGPAAEAAANTATSELRFEIQTASLNFRMLQLDIDTSFSDDEADYIIEEIASLYQQSDADNRNRLSFAIDTAAKSFASAGRLDLVERLENSAQELVRNSESVLQIMLQSLGRRLLADFRAPFSWISPDGEMRDIHARYRRYADRAKNSGYSAFYLAYELLLRHLEKRQREEILSLIKEAEELESPRDTLAFIRILEDLAAGTWKSSPDAKTRRVSDRVRTVICEYRSESEILALIAASEIECS